jgi:hypothetical protein
MGQSSLLIEWYVFATREPAALDGGLLAWLWASVPSID